MFPPNFGFILPSNLISGQKPQIHTAECTNLCVYTELSRAPYNIHRSPVFIFSQILILFLLRKFDPIPVVSVFMSLPCQTRSCSCPPTCPRCLFDSSCIRRERASSTSSPCLLLHPRTTATHKYLSLIFGFFWILAFTTKVLNKKQIFNTFFPILPSSTLVFAVPDREINSGKCISAAILTVIKCKSKSQRKPQTMFTSFIFVFQQFISLFLSSLGS